MQPPPPPLDIAQLSMLISQAAIIAVGTIDEAKETEEKVSAVLVIEKILKGDAPGRKIPIRETVEPISRRMPDVVSGGEEGTRKAVAVHKAGPHRYHGRYRPGQRIVVFLETIKEGLEYRPLGSGAYDRHLCAFPIQTDGIKALYFKFADDLIRYTGSEEQFIHLIMRLKADPKEVPKNG